MYPVYFAEVQDHGFRNLSYKREFYKQVPKNGNVMIVFAEEIFLLSCRTYKHQKSYIDEIYVFDILESLNENIPPVVLELTGGWGGHSHLS